MESGERAKVRDALAGLAPYLSAYATSRLQLAGLRGEARRDGRSELDIQAGTGVMIEHWQEVFARELPSVVRAWLHELRDIRNRWAHEQAFTAAEVDRALDTIALVGRAIGAPVAHKGPATSHGDLETPPSRSPSRQPRHRTQRDLMREIHRRWTPDRERIIAEYAAAERRGEVERRGNKSGRSAEEYARALLADGEKKGWLES